MTMIRLHKSRGRRGFTLVELAIVVAIAGLLFAGLWRLMSSGTQQLSEQAAADQLSKLSAAVKGYLSSSNGQAWLTAMAGTNAAATTYNLPLPAGAAPAGDAACKTTAPMNTVSTPAATAVYGDFCDYLPAGFSAATTNPFGQSYEIKVRRTTGAAGTTANAYEFMIVSTGGDVIPDSQGGRISALLGGDGGFVYTNNDVCGSPIPQFVCGAFGGFAVNLNNYSSVSSFTTSANGGRIGLRSFITADGSNSSPWLARSLLPGDNAVAPVFNTMTTPLFIGTNNINVAGADITGTGRIVFTAVAGKTGIANFNNTGGTGAAVVVTGTGTGDAVTINSGDLTVSNTINANSFVYSSDRRLKHDIERLQGALPKLMQIQGVSFRWNRDDAASLGLIAQDVEQVYPEAVTLKPDGTKGVDYGKLIGPIIESIRELKAENESLRKEIERLK
jgi:prepilin-type N-terminal cleavage/methylation domain-containing protein